MKNLADLTGNLGTIGRLADRAVKAVDQMRAERDLYRSALRTIRDGRTNDPADLAEETLRQGERL